MAHETHNSLRALLDGAVRVEDDELAVSDAWIDPREMALRYVGLDVGGWLDRHVALVSADRLRWSREEGVLGGWRAEVTRAEVEAEEARLTEGSGPIDLAALPPVVTGPFGYTISPLLIGAGLMAEADDGAPPRPPGEDRAGDEDAPRAQARALDRAGDWIGAPIAARHDVAGRGAEAGPVVADLLIDPDDLRITHAVVEAGGARRAVPVEHLGPREGTEAPVPLALTRAEIEAMPEIAPPGEARGQR